MLPGRQGEGAVTRDGLVAALRTATEGSRLLDFWCWWYGMSIEASKLDPQPPPDDCVRDAMGSHASPGCSPTRSLDWALQMLPSGLDWHVGRHRAMPTGDLRHTCFIPGTDYQACHASAPIAVCIAALLARGARG